MAAGQPAQQSNAGEITSEPITDFGRARLDGSGFRHRVLTMLRGNIPTCPACNVQLDIRQRRRVFDDRPIRCQQCGSDSRPRSGTILQGSTIAYGQFWILLNLLALNIHPEKIATLLEMSRSSVYEWRKRLTNAGMI